MAGTTLSLTDKGKTMVEEARLKKGWTQDQLASNTYLEGKEEPISGKTIQNFLSQQAISMRCFHAICHSLELDWEVVTGRKPVQENVQTNASDSGTASTTTISNNTVNQSDVKVKPGGIVIGIAGTVNQHH